MIMANELRIGNYYKTDIESQMYKLRTSDFMDYLNDAQANNGEIENIYPVSPTVKLLEEFGFKKDGRTMFYKDNFAVALQSPGLSGFCIRNVGIIATFSHLHQLQNIYYHLTGKELDYDKTTNT